MNFSVSTNERGVSGLVTAILMVAIVLAFSGVIAAILLSQARTITTATDVQVQNADIIKTQAVALVSISVKNVGTTQIENCTVTIYGNDNILITIDIGPISVGATESGNSNPNPTAFTVGFLYPATLNGTAVDGSTVAESFSITARS